MRAFKKILMVMLAASLTVSTTGCSAIAKKGMEIGKEAIGKITSLLPGEEDDSQAEYAGKYYCSYLEEDGEVVDVATFEAYGMVYTLDLKEDGTFVFGFVGLDSEDELTVGTWKYKNNAIILQVEGDPDIELPYENGKVTLEQDDFKMVLDINYKPSDPEDEKAQLIGNTESEESSKIEEAVGENSEKADESQAADSSAVAEESSQVPEPANSEPVEAESQPAAEESSAAVTEESSLPQEESSQPAAEENTSDADGVVEVGGYKYTVDDIGIYIPVIDKNILLAETNDYKIELTGIESTDYWYELKVHIVNKSNKDTRYSISNLAVNHVCALGFMSEEIPAGKEVYSEISIAREEVVNRAIVSFDNLQFYFEAYDPETYDEISRLFYDVTVADPNETDVLAISDFDESVVKVLFDNEYSYAVCYSSGVDEDGDYVMYVYSVNKLKDKDIMISPRDVSVNGVMIDPFWAFTLDRGTAGITEISWDADELSTANIDANGKMEIEMTMEISDRNDWFVEPYASETVKVTFE